MEELIEKAKEGDKDAFTTLLVNNKAKLYQIARAKLQNEDDIEDAIQETMILAYTKMRTLKENSKFNAWIIKILLNKCTEVYRKNKNKPIPFEKVEKVVEDNISDKMEAELEKEKVLRVLSEEEKVLIWLYYGNGYTTKQLSEILEKNENTLKTKIKRMKEKIRKELGGEL